MLQLSLLSGLPMVLLIALAARPLNGFIFGNVTGSEIVETYAGPVIAMLTVTAIFQIVMQTSGAVLMGMGRMRTLVLAVIVGIAAKLAVSFALAPLFGIYGIIAATALCFIIMTAIIVRVLRQNVSFRIFGGKRWIGLIGSTALIAVIGILLDQACRLYVTPFASVRLNDMVQSIVICAIVGAAIRCCCLRRAS